MNFSCISTFSKLYRHFFFLGIIEVKSVKKKYKDKKFAAGCSREVIERGAEMLGWDLDTLIERTILAMRASEHVD